MALKLTRKNNTSIVIDGNIIITVTNAFRGRADILVEAPKDVRVDRKEIHDLRRRKGQVDERD